VEGNHTSLSHFVSSCTITVRFLHARLPSTGLSRVELFISVRRAAISQVNAAETGNYQRFREALTRARPVTLRSAGTPVMHRGIVAAQPLCKHLRKWQNLALGRSKNSYAESATSPRHCNPARRHRKAGPVYQWTAFRSRDQGQLVLLACLLDNLGRAIPYKRLFTVIGRKSDNEYSRHLLRQYMLVLREILLANKAPFVIATVHDVGYALCEIAENPRHTSRNRRSNGVSRLAKTVRHWRIAAGLTKLPLRSDLA
jgi:hypothetical protein